MKKIDNFDEIKEPTGEKFKTLPAGGSVCGILAVEDVPMNEATGKGDYWKIKFDIIEGEYKNWFEGVEARCGFWFGEYIQSYKTKSTGFFKTLITSLENSNDGYKWDWDERRVSGKKVGLTIGEKEFTNKNGYLSIKSYVDKARSIDMIRKGEFDIPEKICLPVSDFSIPVVGNDLSDDELPF